MTPRWRQRRWLAVLAALLVAVPLLWPAISPLEDLPGHIGRYRVMLGTDSATLSQWYAFHWHMVGNLGVDAIVYALAPLVGLEPAVKLAVIAIVMLTAAGILGIAQAAHGRITIGAWFALALTYNFPLQFGFVNYALAMALALDAFALWLWLGNIGRTRLRAALFVPVAILIWFAHAMGWGVLGLLVFASQWQRERNTDATLFTATLRAGLAVLPLVVPMFLLIGWRTEDSAGVTGHFFDFPTKLTWLAGMFRDRWRWLDIASATAVALFLYTAIRRPDIRWQRPLTAAAILLLVAFVVMPFGLFGSAFADMRLAPYCAIVALLAVDCAAVPARWRHWLAVGGIALFAIRIVATTASYALYAQTYTRELAAVAHIPYGARVVALVGTGGCARPWGLKRINHLPAIAIARRAAFANDEWRMEGAPLLTIRPGVPRQFAFDPSQTALPNYCRPIGDLRRIDDALAIIPRGDFDYLWLIEPSAYDPRLLSGMTPVWRNRSSVLYRIDKTPTATPH